MSVAKRQFSPLRFSLSLTILMLLVGVAFGFLLARGLFEGYFAAFPVVPLFFLALGIAAGLIGRRLTTAQSPKMYQYVMGVSMARLLLAALFAALGLWLFPNHRVAFISITLLCYLIAMVASVKATVSR